MKKNMRNIAFLLFVCLVMAFSIWGPEAIAEYRDREILGVAHAQTVETAGEGYRYTLSSNERLYILAKCLNSQSFPESDQNAMTRKDEDGLEYQEPEGSYAFVVNHRGPSGKEITDAEIIESCNEGLQILKDLGILPDSVRKVEASAYDAVLYSAIDVPEPQNNVAVWKVSLSTSQKNARKENRLIDAYIDADDGRIYEFYARSSMRWEEMDPDEIIARWSEYMGLEAPEVYEDQNPLLETTPYFKKYVFAGMGNEKTIVTIGFYEGINEFFLKVSK